MREIAWVFVDNLGRELEILLNKTKGMWGWMKINLRCINFECHEILEVDLNNDFRYQYTCKYCDTVTKGVLTLQRFQVLFDLGIICLKKGFYKEAVSNFASSLERCYEYSIKRILYNNDKTKEEIEDIWKFIKSQSERQYGAFLFLYYNVFGQKIETPSVKFRNDVTHNGYFPTEEETIKYAEDIFNAITKILFNIVDLKKDYEYLLPIREDEVYIDYISFISPFDFFTLTDEGSVKNNKPKFHERYRIFYENENLDVAVG